MASAFQHFSGSRIAALALALASSACGLVYLRAWRSTLAEEAASSRGGTPGALTHMPVSIEPFDPGIVSILVSSRKPEGTTAPAGTGRYRLAGTFAVQTDNGNRRQKAILDDTVTGEQRLVGEGDPIADGSVISIGLDRVTLQTASGLKELVLEFAGAPATVASTETNRADGSASVTSNRFGCIQIAEGRWQFSRQPLLDYYQELLDEPDRMVAIFDTMKPVRDERNRITGYVVGVEGEKSFFEAVGLHEGDIVRQVNSVDMTSRRRAEFFIDEFLKNRMSAVVLEVEREGKRQKQVYQMKDQ